MSSRELLRGELRFAASLASGSAAVCTLARRVRELLCAAGMGAAGSKSQRLEKALGTSFPESEHIYGLENFGNTCYCNSVLQASAACARSGLPARLAPHARALTLTLLLPSYRRSTTASRCASGASNTRPRARRLATMRTIC